MVLRLLQGFRGSRIYKDTRMTWKYIVFPSPHNYNRWLTYKMHFLTYSLYLMTPTIYLSQILQLWTTLDQINSTLPSLIICWVTQADFFSLITTLNLQLPSILPIRTTALTATVFCHPSEAALLHGTPHHRWIYHCKERDSSLPSSIYQGRGRRELSTWNTDQQHQRYGG